MERVVSSERSRRDASNGVSVRVVRGLGAEKIAMEGRKIGLFGRFRPFCFASCGRTRGRMALKFCVVTGHIQEKFLSKCHEHRPSG